MNDTEKAAVKAAIDQGIADGLRQMQNGRTPDLAKAFVAVWGEIANVKKDATNPHFKNEYASLEAVLNEVKPKLTKHGLALVQVPGAVRDGYQSLITTLVHQSGQAWTFVTELPLGKNETAQAAGSCITYARRYVLVALFGIAAVDDDGNAASEEADEEPEDDESSALLTQEMAAFRVIKGEKAADAVKRFEAMFKTDVSGTGDKELVNKYISERTRVKKAASK